MGGFPDIKNLSLAGSSKYISKLEASLKQSILQSKFQEGKVLTLSSGNG